MNIREYLKNNIVIFDGAFGTQLQLRGMIAGTLPELLNLTEPELIKSIHKSYIDAGSNVISTNTFGANRKKLGSKEKVEEVISAAIINAKSVANGNLVALDIGPIGELIEPMGTMTFDEAYELYKEQIIAANGKADLVIIETMSDLYETKAAVLAAKENSNMPIICSMSFMENMRTFTGSSVEAFALTISPFVDALGINCSLGPVQILPIMEQLSKYTELPLIIQANAGLPDARMNYSVKPSTFARVYEQYYDLGVNIFGGCCGTSPEYIKEVKTMLANKTVKHRKVTVPAAVCSASTVVLLDNNINVIGERINPTGKKLMKQALIEENYDYISNQALAQIDAGANILDVNAGLPEIDEKAVLTKMIKFLQSISNVPLQIDCGKPEAIEQALRYYNGKAIVNSVNGEEKSLKSILPIVKKYGASVVGLTIDERGLPKTTEDRIEIAEKIIKAAKSYGIKEEDIYIDCLTLTVSVERDQALKTLDAIAKIKDMYRVKSVLGVSNISFGLQNRQIVNSTFLKTALAYGLDLPIINPNISDNMKAIETFKSTNGDYDRAFFYKEFADSVENNINFTASTEVVSPAQMEDIFYCIKRGLSSAKIACEKLLESNSPLEVIDKFLIPALNVVGDEYEKGILFLPQLIAAAESAKSCFEVVKSKMPNSDTDRGKIVLATVKGDIHDIGKNIVKTVLENYGYKVIDLGKNVEPELVLETCLKYNLKLAGLSALMTTTVGAMADTIELIKRNCPDCKVMVGGAVLNEDYAKQIGADYYAKDANRSVKIADLVFGN